MTPDVKDPTDGRSFDGRYDDHLDCGCVIFYRGGTVRCEEHDWQRASRMEQELATITERHNARIDAERQAGERPDNDKTTPKWETVYMSSTGVVGIAIGIRRCPDPPKMKEKQ